MQHNEENVFFSLNAICHLTLTKIIQQNYINSIVQRKVICQLVNVQFIVYTLLYNTGMGGGLTS